MNTETQLQKFSNFEWNNPKIIASLIKGKDALKLYQALEEDRKQRKRNR